MSNQVTGVVGTSDWLLKEVDETINKDAKDILDEARDRTPVGETGRLKASWELKQATSTTHTAEVENVAPYAAYVENGTEKMQPRGMLANAVAKVMRD